MSQSHEGHDHVWADDLTRNQELVLGTLAHADGPLSAYDLLDLLRAEGLRAPLQIYRALEKLTERGLAHRVESLNAFVCCAGEQNHEWSNFGFAICDRCSRVEEFAGQDMEDRLSGWCESAGFTASRMTIELHGTCRECTAAAG